MKVLVELDTEIYGQKLWVELSVDNPRNIEPLKEKIKNKLLEIFDKRYRINGL